MAIGSNPEVGTSFKQVKDFTSEDWDRWFKYMRDNWSGYLQTGYAVLVHKKEGNPFYDIDARRLMLSGKKREEND